MTIYPDFGYIVRLFKNSQTFYISNSKNAVFSGVCVPDLIFADLMTLTGVIFPLEKNFFKKIFQIFSPALAANTYISMGGVYVILLIHLLFYRDRGGEF